MESVTKEFYQRLGDMRFAGEDSLLRIGKLVENKKSSLFLPHSKYIYILKSGTLYIYHEFQEKMLGVAMPNMPIGMVEKLTPEINVSYYCETDVCFLRIPEVEFYKHFQADNERARYLIDLLVFKIGMLIEMNEELIHGNRYDLIKTMISRYLLLKEISTDFKIGIASFIMKKTGMSKSSVYSILSSLREGGYISMRNGKLISIDKPLPSTY